MTNTTDTLNGSRTMVERRDAKSGRFLAGNNGGGRKLGSRNKLAEDFLHDLHSEWLRSGAKALERAAEDDPLGFVKVVANTLPRKLQADVMTIDVELQADAASFAKAWSIVAGKLREQPELIEHDAD